MKAMFSFWKNVAEEISEYKYGLYGDMKKVNIRVR